MVVANLNGIMTDDGTAWEMGYAYGLGKFTIGLYTDWRARFPAPDEVVNLMMQCSMNVLALTRRIGSSAEELAGRSLIADEIRRRYRWGTTRQCRRYRSSHSDSWPSTAGGTARRNTTRPFRRSPW